MSGPRKSARKGPKVHLSRRKESESPREAALRILKIRGEMTVVELTRSLKVTQTAVRRHLQTLQTEGLIEYTSQQRAAGRPVNVYRLTQKATKEIFPSGYEELAERVLNTIYDIDGHKSVFEFLVTSNHHLAKDLLSASGKTQEERVKTLVSFFTRNGYMTDYRKLPDGRFFLFHQNCAIYNLAEKFRQLCFVELRLIEMVAGGKVTRQQYIFKKQPICGYLISADQGST